MSAADLPIGTELAGYRLEALLGRGGMGIVWRARDLALDRDVALKLLAPHLGDDVSFRERFLTESRVAASLEHPNVVPIHDAGEIDGQLYIAMRLVEGSDLKATLREGPLEPAPAVRIVEQIAGALDAAHARGLVHRDVKPSNVLLDEQGHVYLADFGLSRYLGEAGSSLGAAGSLGTADYVAPEQIRGGEIDGRVDVYALGCLLYECLAGVPPFRRGSEAATLYAQLEDAPPVLPGLERVLPRALAKDPSQRFDTCGELVEAARKGLGIAEPRRGRWPLAFAVVGLTLIGASLLGFFIARGGGLPPEPGADSVVRIDPAKNRFAESISVGRGASGVAVGGGYVWVTSFADDNVWRIDPRTHNALKISAQGSPTGIAYSSGSVVVANGPQHSVGVIDGGTGTVDFVAGLPGVSSGVLQVAGGPGGAWFADPDTRTAGKVSDALAGGGAIKRVEIPPDKSTFLSAFRSFDDLAVGEGAVWVAGDVSERAVWKVDPQTERVVARVPLPFIPRGIAAGEAAVWVTSLLDDTVARIDPGSSRVVARIRVGRGAAGIATGAGSVWVANSVDGTVSRIDPKTNRVVATIPVGSSPDAIAVGGSGVWVTTRHRQPGGIPPDAIKIGVLSDCTGPFGQAYDLTLAGAELPLIERGGKLAGSGPAEGIEGASIQRRPVNLFFGCANGTGASSLAEARRLVEGVGVDVLAGPLTADEELPLQEYAKQHPNVAFVNGPASAQLAAPASNFFSLHTEGAQWMAGLGSYAYHELGWRTAVVIADEQFNPFSWAQTAGFVAEFCSLGGTIARRIWIPPGTEDYSQVIAQIPRAGVGGLVVASGDQAVIALALSEVGLRGDPSRRMIIGQEAQGPALAPLGRRISGLVTGGPIPVSVSRRYLAAFRRAFPRLGTTFAGGLFDLAYYADVEATLQALEAVRGDLSDGEKRFMAALGKIELDLPNGRTTLDVDRQAIAPNYIVQFESPFKQRLLRTIPGVEQTFNGYFSAADPPPSRQTPACVKRTPPVWAR